jgi:hypothetical protein
MERNIPRRASWALALALALALAAALGSARAQGGKDFLQWLKEYSPTGYFIIDTYEAGTNKPGDHKKWLEGQTRPFPAVAVHESGHMRNLELLAKNNFKSYYIGDQKDYKLIPSFKPFSSSVILPDIPAALRNFQTEVYIQGGEGMYSVSFGILGIMEEWNQYITGLKSGVEMSACFKAHFNSSKDWDDLGNDMTPSVWSNAEFRYFCLRYLIRAKTDHADVYAKITTSPEMRQLYTHLVAFAEKTMAEWIAVLEVQKMDTRTRNGFDWHWKFWNEIQKAEYKEIEKVMLIPSTAIRPLAGRAGLAMPAFPEGRVDILGRSMRTGAPMRGNHVSIFLP